jgi:hypothetical protein
MTGIFKAEEKDKAIEQGQEPKPPAPEDELSEKDRDKASGGLNPQPLPPGLASGHDSM